jgi:hypothetical protein
MVHLFEKPGSAAYLIGWVPLRAEMAIGKTERRLSTGT